MLNDLCEAEIAEPAPPTEPKPAERSSQLQHYEAIAATSRAMLAAAHANDWAEVTRQEARCCALIATLKSAATTVLSPRDDACRMLLLRQILADDARIRSHAEPWLEPITPFISTLRKSAEEK